MSSYENFCTTLCNLKDIYEYDEPYEFVVAIGSVMLYRFCFDQSWKAMKEILESEGIPEGKTGSPKMVLKAAYQAGMIQDEQLWLKALATRNNVAHAYNHAVALDIIRQTKKSFYQMFLDLKSELDER